jgi:hypothetical protein
MLVTPGPCAAGLLSPSRSSYAAAVEPTERSSGAARSSRASSQPAIDQLQARATRSQPRSVDGPPLGTERRISAQTQKKRMQFATIQPAPVDRENPRFAGITPLLERFASTTENRGVPGSSPGLAIVREAW